MGPASSQASLFQEALENPAANTWCIVIASQMPAWARHPQFGLRKKPSWAWILSHARLPGPELCISSTYVPISLRFVWHANVKHISSQSIQKSYHMDARFGGLVVCWGLWARRLLRSLCAQLGGHYSPYVLNLAWSTETSPGEGRSTRGEPGSSRVCWRRKILRSLKSLLPN